MNQAQGDQLRETLVGLVIALRGEMHDLERRLLATAKGKASRMTSLWIALMDYPSTRPEQRMAARRQGAWEERAMTRAMITFDSIEAMLGYVEARINEKLNEVRYRTAPMLQRHGASKAEIDDTLAWTEREMQKVLRAELERMREELPEFTRLH